MIVLARSVKFGLGLVVCTALAIFAGRYLEGVRTEIAESNARRQTIAAMSTYRTDAVKGLPLGSDVASAVDVVLRACRSQLDALLEINGEAESKVRNELRAEVGLHMRYLQLEKQSSEKAKRVEAALARLAELGVSRDDLIEHLKEEILEDANCQTDDDAPEMDTE